MTRGYSDRINHAFAFAAKHHDQQVRKGTRLPYFTHPANVAVILTRYGCDEDTVLAGILHDVIEDCVRSPYTRESLERRIRDKFGDEVVSTVLMVSKRELDDDGNPLSAIEKNEDYLRRLADASDSARWVCAADKIHNGQSLLADLRRTKDVADHDSVWNRFRLGRAGTVTWYRSVYARLQEIGFQAPIMEELRETAAELERWGAMSSPAQRSGIESAGPTADSVTSLPPP
jgi:(p)ppGpp synthase/HD superfamily hydrolase